KRAFRFYFLKPFVKERDLRAFRYQFRKVRLLQKIHNRLATAFDFRYGVGKFSLSKKNGSLSARIHHEHVRPELLQAPGEILPFRVVVDESKKIEISLRIAHDAFEIVNLKQAQVPMIILDAFLLQLRALLRGKLVSLALLFGPHRALPVVIQQRFAIVRAPTIGSSGDFHLQDAEIDAQLQFFAAVEPGDLAHLNSAALVGPILQNGMEIQAHRSKHPTFNVRLSISSRTDNNAARANRGTNFH